MFIIYHYHHDHYHWSVEKIISYQYHIDWIVGLIQTLLRNGGLDLMLSGSVQALLLSLFIYHTHTLFSLDFLSLV